MTRLDHLRLIRDLQAAIVSSLESTTPETTPGVELCRERIELHRVDIEVLEEERHYKEPEPVPRVFKKGHRPPVVELLSDPRIREVGP